ncbi:hypothetical protein FVEN_g12611 [Fusarium venenatum]|uniref:Uncharacterized protein n=1 Tax=Fusarium venenatum TaxID=56646 RepID=A0A2L2TQY4_9HYPO|nr:uncharacterized protein FVRRES_07716 [Fusarium venenatum]KAG8362028.1 hypothetical protein FVEN_g12611 [Fusarium venenatum]CEI63280.1 unnamed protein product [Fusarium venenatum]
MSWTNLPTELRNQVLNYIVEDHMASRKQKIISKVAPYTSVSREWQSLF